MVASVPATKKNPHWSELPIAPVPFVDPFGMRRDVSVVLSLLASSNNVAQAKVVRDWFINAANQADLIAGGAGTAVAGGAP